MKNQLEELVKKYLNGQCSEEERRQVEDWYEQLNEDDGRAFSAWTDTNISLKNNLLAKIAADKKQRNRTLVFLRAAAAIVILISIGILFKLNIKEADTKKDLLQFATSENINIRGLKETRLIMDKSSSFNLKGNAGITYEGDELRINNDSQKQADQKLKMNEHGYSTLVVPYGRRADVLLADGSRVWLNSGSRLVYPNTFKGSKREVYLQGEAFFEVFHNKEQPFHVYVKDVDVKVLGTSFNVRAYPDEKNLKTTLLTGSVELSAENNKNRTRLIPGRMAIYENGSPFNVHTVNTEIQTSWKSGYLYLRNEPLQNLLKTLERYYNVPVALEDSEEDRYFSGRLTLQNDIKEVIDIIALTTGYHSLKTERGWILRKINNQE
ncbi:MAG: FecR domain-containing protein [Pedobacter sp.]|uniref:FecR domain-containing protein n=1 Tax=Pedobacter sp. TaxID=1411316 RepID=UPI0035650E87